MSNPRAVKYRRLALAEADQEKARLYQLADEWTKASYALPIDSVRDQLWPIRFHPLGATLSSSLPYGP